MRSMPAKRVCQSLLLLASCVMPALLAYNTNGNRWADGTTTFYTGLAGTAPSGTHWSTALAAAMKQWTDKTSFVYVANKDYVNPCNGYTRSQSGTDFPSGNGDHKNGADFRTNVCGNDFGSGVLALTLTSSVSGPFGFSYLQEADIVFNGSSAYTWDIYDGPKTANIDFGRVVLHELGHALGLDHENTASAIMAPRISNLYQLQPDDIDGAQALYGPETLCPITSLPLNGVITNSLGLPDCRIKDFFGGGTDDSFVDAYRLSLSAPVHIVADMVSSQLDPVLVLTDSRLRMLDIFDDNLGTCNAHMDTTLAAGDYLLLANTYAQPAKCGTNQGSYSLSLASNPQPALGKTLTTSGATASAAVFAGGASADGGATFQTSFTGQDSISVGARILMDPSQIGQNGKVYVLILLSNGSKFSMTSTGKFVAFSGDLSQLASYKSGPLAALEQISVAQNQKTAGTGLAGLWYSIYVGYALDSKPGDIQYSSVPIGFNIAR